MEDQKMNLKNEIPKGLPPHLLQEKATIIQK
jgi:hypothetical protein